MTLFILFFSFVFVRFVIQVRFRGLLLLLGLSISSVMFALFSHRACRCLFFSSSLAASFSFLSYGLRCLAYHGAMCLYLGNGHKDARSGPVGKYPSKTFCRPFGLTLRRGLGFASSRGCQ
jgi:hypothetical protein